jgi:hypothetical protein
MAGEVAEDATVDIDITAGAYNMIAHPFAADLPMNGGGIAWLTSGGVGGTTEAGGDNIKIWNPTTGGYKTYFLWNSATSYTSYNGQWIDGDSLLGTSDSIPLGNGAWYLSRSAGADYSVTIPKPY